MLIYVNKNESARSRETTYHPAEKSYLEYFFSWHIFHQKISHSHREAEFKYKVEEGYDQKKWEKVMISTTPLLYF